MVRLVVRRSSYVLSMGLAGSLCCAFDASGPGGDGSASVADSTSGGTSEPTTSGGSMPTGDATSADDASPTTESSSDGGCVPGEAGCTCNDGECEAGLSCVDGICLSPTCGDGVVQRGEQCDPGSDPQCGPECQTLPGPRSIGLGHEHTCVVTEDHRLRCWGSGGNGRTGLGTTDDVGDARGEPASLMDLDAGGDVRRVALGTSFSCALRDTDDVVCWGLRDAGRLGDGLDDPDDDIGDEPGESAATLAPVSIPGLVRDLSLGGVHACALSDQPFPSSVYCWGDGGMTGMGEGRLGYGSLEDIGQTNTPADVGPVALPAEVDVLQVAAGAGHTCVLDASGDVLCWGDGVNGVLGTMSALPIGDDEPVSAATPVLLGGPAEAIAAGSQHTCALMADGAVRCWGLGELGRLGYGDQVTIGDDEPPSGFSVDLGDDAVAISAGRAHTCAVLASGELRCWGDGEYGKLGRGNEEAVGDSEPVSSVDPIEVSSDRGVTVLAVDAGGDHTCAVLSDGGLRCWGRGHRGQLGYGNTDDLGDGNRETPAMAGDVDFE